MTSSRTASRALPPNARALTRPRAVGALAGFVLFAFVLPAAAQRTAQDIETARQLYNQGIELRDKGDSKGALDKFRAAHALGNTPVTGIELCKLYAALRQPVEAREICLGVARIPPLPQETSRSQEARTEAAKVAEAEKPKIGALRLKVRGIPEGREALVLVDGAAVPAAALGEPRAVNPGTHIVSAKVGTGPETKATVETREGETKDLELTVQAPVEESPVAGPATPAPESPKEKGRKSALPTVSFVVAGVAGAVGVLAGLTAMSIESDLEGQCVNKACGRELHEDLDLGKTWGNVSTVAFVIGGVALAAGVVTSLTSSSKQGAAAPPRAARATPTIRFGGAGVHGTF